MEISTNLDRHAGEFRDCLIHAERACSEMKPAFEELANAADRIQAITVGSKNRDAMAARDALSRAVHYFREAQAMVTFGHDQGSSYLEGIEDRQ